MIKYNSLGPVLPNPNTIRDVVVTVNNNFAAPKTTEYCKQCKSNRPSNYFFCVKSGEPRKTCCACRRQELPQDPLPQPPAQPFYQPTYRYLPPPVASPIIEPARDIQPTVDEIGM